MAGEDNDRIMLSDDAVGVGVADGIEAYALNIRVLALQENKKHAGNCH